MGRKKQKLSILEDLAFWRNRIENSVDKKSRMYEVNGKRVKTWTPCPGCDYECCYCYGPEIYRRFSQCYLCRGFIPHVHLERLEKPPRFKAGETWFLQSMGDFAFLHIWDKRRIIDIVKSYPKTLFYLQSKNPGLAFVHFSAPLTLPDNLVLGTTIESDFQNSKSAKEKPYSTYSKAPPPICRFHSLNEHPHPRKYIAIEPIMQFDLPVLLDWIRTIKPEFVYVGYLNPAWKAKKLQIPEPKLLETLALCEKMKEFTEVRTKTLRQPWDF